MAGDATESPSRSTSATAMAAMASTTTGTLAPHFTSSMNGSLRTRLQSQRMSSISPRPQTAPLQPPELPRRRSSLLSYSSIEDATNSFTQDILHPTSAGKGRNRLGGISEDGTSMGTEEVTNWHSSPLAFAILPAIAGLLFKNGSAFVTDALLLGLAAVFMNWSIRLPWDWYYSAQAVRADVEPSFSDVGGHDGGDDDDDEPMFGAPEGKDFGSAVADENALDTTSEASVKFPSPPPGQKRPRADRPPISRAKPSVQNVGARAVAAADLRRQELMALLSTFVLPAMAAYLLHIIRAQLSRPSTTLVSDYNLSIFLLAAEIRPLRQLVRLVSNRTLHLQRTVQSSPSPAPSEESDSVPPAVVTALETRLEALEMKIPSTATTDPVSIAQKTDLATLSVTLRKTYEPRLESLERAVRRYEKRSTTLAMLTEQRLQSLEARIQESLSLAAVAAENSQRRSIGAGLVEGLLKIIAWPFKMAVWAISLPLLFTVEVYEWLYVILLGRITGQGDAKGKRGNTGGKRPAAARRTSSSR
ncbi:hypothetical protein K431DRAFT_284944 [Polychaeton citri CBS 116435]|uniref:Uncharacterized protein n=1 Tax=Polychaeton citri CBS 116435 TaxID=1314669 RepID=A0A9P4UQS5_9PEZI|nr:hypothetical protein K431DRAFT_284944 [Polychaeton citri CBS 116435]